MEHTWWQGVSVSAESITPGVVNLARLTLALHYASISMLEDGDPVRRKVQEYLKDYLENDSGGQMLRARVDMWAVDLGMGEELFSDIGCVAGQAQKLLCFLLGCTCEFPDTENWRIKDIPEGYGDYDLCEISTWCYVTKIGFQDLDVPSLSPVDIVLILISAGFWHPENYSKDPRDRMYEYAAEHMTFLQGTHNLRERILEKENEHKRVTAELHALKLSQLEQIGILEQGETMGIKKEELLAHVHLTPGGAEVKAAKEDFETRKKRKVTVEQ